MLQRGGGEGLLLVSPAGKRRERRDAAGLRDGQLVVLVACEDRQLTRGLCLLIVGPVAGERDEWRDQRDEWRDVVTVGTRVLG